MRGVFTSTGIHIGDAADGTKTMRSDPYHEVDIALIGAGIMSSTFAMLFGDMAPDRSVAMFETLDGAGLESSQAWNNAGTGHAGNCELNYTPRTGSGDVNIERALAVNSEFDMSRQLWAHWVRTGVIPEPRSFISPCPHISLVWGNQDTDFLEARYRAMSAHHSFRSMEFTRDPAAIAEWAPLTMENRRVDMPVAATRVMNGTDVDYGALTQLLIKNLAQRESFKTFYRHQVKGLRRDSKGRWLVTANGRDTGDTTTVSAKFVFIGAGGAALSLLQEARMPEVASYSGFPVSGLWLKSTNETITARHRAKVYGAAPTGSPPMSVPHLDTRIVDGKASLLFGPYAGFSTKFLKHGSWTDLFRSMTAKNLKPTLEAAADNLSLVRYLIEQIAQKEQTRFEALQAFYPGANPADWIKVVAGQRVQIIRPEKDSRGRSHGVLKFGTELVCNSDHSLVGVLGASPGASVAASIALKVIHQCFAQEAQSTKGRAALQHVFPSYGKNLTQDAELCLDLRHETAKTLKIHDG